MNDEMSDRRLLEAASSSEDDSSDDEEEEEEMEVRYNNIKSLDDLPSDDSASLVSNDEDVDDDQENTAFGSHLHNDEQEVTVAERVEKQRQVGIDKSLRSAKQGRKSAAVAAAKAAIKKRRVEEDQHPSSKKSKHAPTEASSTRSAFYSRGAPLLNSSGIGVEIGAHKYKPRDPRMSSMTGHLDEQHFAHNYEFIQEMRAAEIEKLKQRISVRKATGKKGQKARKRIGLTNEDTTIEDDKAELLRLSQEMKEWERSQVVREAKQSVNRKLRQEVESGQRGAYHVRRKDRKKLELEAKFDVLRKKGGDKAVDKVLEKKRKKNKSKDTSLMKVNL